MNKVNKFYSMLCFIVLTIIGSKNIFAQAEKKSSNQHNAPTRLFGITIDESSFNEEGLGLNDQQQIENIITEIKKIKNAQQSKKALTVRIVLPVGCENGGDCDPTEPIITNKLDNKYVLLMQQISQQGIAKIMAEVIDSDIESSTKCVVVTDVLKSANKYLDRVKKMYAKIGKYVDIWEIGNEANGDWVGGSVEGDAKNKIRRKIVVAQIKAAYDFLTQKKLENINSNQLKNENEKVPQTAITYYFSGVEENRHCYENKNDALLGWLNAEGEHFKDVNGKVITFPNLDYVLISYYPEDNFYLPKGAKESIPIVLSAQDWVNVFAVIKENFGAEISYGLGEVGAQCYYSKKNMNCGDCKVLLLDYDTQEKNPCDVYDKKGEVIEARNCPCCYCAQVKVVTNYYQELDNEILMALKNDNRFLNSHRFIGGYFNWYYSADVVNKTAKGNEADKLQAEKVRNATIAAFKNFVE